MTKLVELLYIIANALQGIAESIEQKRRQKERDELEANPGEWFAGHFNGVPRKPTDKADSDGNPKG